MKQITTILLLLISLSGIGQVSPPTSHTIKVAGSGTSGGTTKYSTTEYGMLTDSATDGLYKFRVDTTVLESQERAVNRAALKQDKITIGPGQIMFGGTANTVRGTDSLYYDSAMARIGAGTTAPQVPFHVLSHAAFSDVAYFENQSGISNVQAYARNGNGDLTNNTVASSISFGGYFGGSYIPSAQDFADVQGVYLGNGTTRKGGLSFRTHNGSSFLSRMTINDSGRVKLPAYFDATFSGTPLYGLGVTGDGTVVNYTPGSGSIDSSLMASRQKLRTDSLTLANAIAAIGSGGTGWGLAGNTVVAGGDFFGSINNASVRLRVNNIERAVFDSVGTFIINGPTTSTPVIMDLRSAGNTKFTVNQVGAVYLAAANGASFGWSGRSRIWCTADGIMTLSNNAQDNLTRVTLGGTNSSYPAIARNAATVEFKLADNSAFTATQSLYDRFGSGSPESVVTAPIGAVYHRTDGGANTSLYVKESGTGNTGWIAK